MKTDAQKEKQLTRVSDSVLKEIAKETNMKSTKKTIIITVIITTLTIAAIIAQAVFFYRLGADTQKDENARVNAAVVTQVKQLKQ